MAINERLGNLFEGWNPDAGGPEALQKAEQAAILTGQPQIATLPDGSEVVVKVDGYGRETGPHKARKSQ